MSGLKYKRSELGSQKSRDQGWHMSRHDKTIVHEMFIVYGTFSTLFPLYSHNTLIKVPPCKLHVCHHEGYMYATIQATCTPPSRLHACPHPCYMHTTIQATCTPPWRLHAWHHEGYIHDTMRATCMPPWRLHACNKNKPCIRHWRTLRQTCDTSTNSISMWPTPNHPKSTCKQILCMYITNYM